MLEVGLNPVAYSDERERESQNNELLYYELNDP